MAKQQEDKLKKTMEEEEAKRKKALGIKSEEEMKEAESASAKISEEERKKKLASNLKASALKKAAIGVRQGMAKVGGGKVGDLYKPGGKKLSGIAKHLEALIESGAATESQIKKYEKITGKKVKKSED
jgi:hypothetical protein